MQFYHSTGQYLKLTRDVYCRKFIADISDGTLYLYTNVYRLFCSDGLFVYADSGGSGNKIHLFWQTYFNNITFLNYSESNTKLRQTLIL